MKVLDGVACGNFPLINLATTNNNMFLCFCKYTFPKDAIINLYTLSCCYQCPGQMSQHV